MHCNLHKQERYLNAIKNAILNISSHIFNEHQNCGEWCTHREDSAKPFTRLPNRKPLTGAALKESIHAIFIRQAAYSDALAPNASSNLNESLNRTVSSKAPKNIHYSKSESLDYRIASAVGQKNIGENYLSLVNESAGLPDNKIFQRAAISLQKTLIKRKANESTVAYKRRRIQVKQRQNEQHYQQELREGPSYESNMCLADFNDYQTVEVPAKTIEPPLVKASCGQETKIVVFDLETTSLSHECEITQIAAQTFDGITFNQYILPEGEIDFRASKITGIQKFNGALFVNGKKINAALPIKDVLQRFSEWLSEHCSNEVILVGHNAKLFDGQHLCRHIEKSGLGDE